MVMHVQLAEALAKVDKPTQKLLKHVIHYEPVQQMLCTFLADTSRSFEDWIWDPKTRDVLSRLQSRVEFAGPQAVKSDPTLQANYEDALVNGIDHMDVESFFAAADAAKQAGKLHFAQKRFDAALNAFRKAADLLKPQLEPCESPSILTPLFVTSCTNASICAIRLQRWPTVREYAQLALAQSPSDGKAWYCLAKVFLWEHRYDEAKDAAEKAALANPSDKLCRKVLHDIDVLQARRDDQTAKDVEQLRHEAERLRLEEETRRRGLPAEDAAYKPRFVWLPHPTSPKSPTSNLHTYMQRSKEHITIEFGQLHDPENGEPPLFECVVTNHSSKTRLATARAPSKKAAQAIASEVAILKLWFDRHAANNLHADDQSYLAQHPEALEAALAVDYSIVHTELRSQLKPTAPSTYTCAIFLNDLDKGMAPAMYLNQLHSQGKLHIDYDIADLSDLRNNIQLFRVSAVLNGRVVATHECPSKKTAKQQVAKVALDVALRESRAMFPDQVEEPSSLWQ
ncbi:hypothetical protein DYB37_003096 [Aphanomyces astaci]|uniref:DRBM domain-containing protein n=2 Tax=Aphanomyces astaci TaxID=112090 RepID=A0A3R7F1C9_APHAT|nr:hypothetical protein DYB37_003096 [Aphanomyces astaci]